MGTKWASREDTIMEGLGLTPQPGSGGLVWTHREDGESETVIAQLKSTEQKGMHVHRADIKSVIYQAHVAHKLPMFVIDFVGDSLLIAMRPMDLLSISRAIADAPLVKGDDFNDHGI